MKKLTIDEGFMALRKFLEKWYGFTNSKDIAFILSGMDMDPAFLQDWIESVNEIVKEEKNE